MESDTVRVVSYKKNNRSKRLISTNPLFAECIVAEFDPIGQRYIFREAGLGWRGKTHRPSKQGNQYFWGMTVDIEDGEYNLKKDGDKLILQL